MENLKIRVNNEDESREVQELFFALGYEWRSCGKKICQYLDLDDFDLCTEHGYVCVTEVFDNNPSKKITLPELRAMVHQEQDEPFLTPECALNDQYAKIEQVRQVEIHGTVKAEPDFNFGAAQARGGAKPRENSHYFINVSDVNEVDFYEIAKRYNVTDPAVQHILKKCLAIGNRGHKDLETDLKDILKTAKRALQINGFGE